MPNNNPNIPAPGSLGDSDLAAKVRAKYPGAYDSKSDSELSQAWLKKYPEYEQYMRPAQPKAQPANDGSTISAQPGFMGKVADLARQGPFKVQDQGANYENYTQEGRAEHPFLSRLGDAAKGARDWLNLAGTTATILGGPESGAPEAALAKEATAPRPLTMSEPPRIPSATRPSFAGPTAPPAVSQRFAREAVGSVTDPSRLGARGMGGVVVPQPKLLPESAPGRFAVPAQDNVVSKTNSFKLTPPPEVHQTPVQNSLNLPAVERPAKMPSAASMKNTPFPKAEPVGFVGPKPTSTSKLVEGIANRLTGVEEPPKAPAGQPLRFPKAEPRTPFAGPAASEAKPAFAGPKETPKETSGNPFERSYETEEARKAAHGEAYRRWEKLGRIELRQALIDAGENLGDRIVSDAKMLGPGAISRRDAIKILTSKGITPPA